MRRSTNSVVMSSVVGVAIVLAATGCQSNDPDLVVDGASTEELTTVTEPTSDQQPDQDGETATNSSTTADSTLPSSTIAPPTVPPTVSSDVFATTPTSRAQPPGAPATETVYEVGTIDRGLDPFVDMATDDLAGRLSIDPSSIEVLTAVLVTWPDASSGCPEPDMAYAQVITDGSVIELGVDGAVYRYHTGGSHTPFPCDRPLDPVPTPFPVPSS